MVDAKDWSEINAATRTLIRDYVAARSSLWPDGIDVAMRNQSALGELIADSLKNVQSWTGEFKRRPGQSRYAALVQRVRAGLADAGFSGERTTRLARGLRKVTSHAV
ncbi:hypothetical protein SAMN05192544_106739 [Paraburkholderia hospita]|nr:hypothetical protein SAMN05192544_106739 [Paraburkholderia hospita]